mgnify:CR=1 FL=1|tara:strand:- start:59 stop:472 length:414 start_codon:yes stop_codon:yes gene_type:complete
MKLLPQSKPCITINRKVQLKAIVTPTLLKLNLSQLMDEEKHIRARLKEVNSWAKETHLSSSIKREFISLKKQLTDTQEKKKAFKKLKPGDLILQREYDSSISIKKGDDFYALETACIIVKDGIVQEINQHDEPEGNL